VEVVVDGVVVLGPDGPTRVDPAEVRAHAREAATRLHTRLAAMP
jgi:hypothetical protein